MFTRETISQELKRIQVTMPAILREQVVKEVEVCIAPEVKMVMEKALEDPDITEEKKQRIRNVLPTLMKKKVVENPKIAEMRDNYMTREIKRAVKEGRLPTRKKLKELGLDKYDN